MKRSIARPLLIGGAVLFAALQAVRPEKNLGPAATGPDSFVARLQAPPEIRQLLDVSCHDCHSEFTRYPWYAEIQPAGWFLWWHVRNGKNALNLSEFGRLSESAQAKRLKYMVEAMQEHEMPLASYTLIHRDAQLSAEQIARFSAWAEEARVKLSR